MRRLRRKKRNLLPAPLGPRSADDKATRRAGAQTSRLAIRPWSRRRKVRAVRRGGDVSRTHYIAPPVLRGLEKMADVAAMGRAIDTHPDVLDALRWLAVASGKPLAYWTGGAK